MKQHTLLSFVELSVYHYSDSHICARTYYTSSLQYLSHFESPKKDFNFLSTDHQYIVYLPRANWRSVSFSFYSFSSQHIIFLVRSLRDLKSNFLDSQAKNSLSCIHLRIYLLVTQQILNRFLSDLVNV